MEKKWYKNSLLIAVLLVIFFPVGLTLMWLFSTWNKAVKIGITALFLLFIVVGASSGGSQPSTNTTKVTGTPSAIPSSATEVVKLNYEVLGREENKVVENIAVLVSSGETQGEAIAMEVKKTCKKPCNIDIWNSREVYTTYKQYQNLSGDSKTPLTQIETFKKQNYVKWGDSLIGSIDFETNSYNDNPLQDWYYKELKAK